MVRTNRTPARLAPLALALVLVAPAARAGDPEVEGIDAAGELSAFDECVTLVQPAPADGGGEMQPRMPAPAVIFVNMDGATLNCTGGFNDDSHTNTSWVCGQYAGQGQLNYAAYNGNKQALLDAVKADWAAFNVNVVSARPASGNYTMNMTGPTNFIGGSVLGVAPLDCYDSFKNNVTFAFVGAQHSVDTAATTVSQEVAHSYGLEHTNNTSDIMYPSVQQGQSFLDACQGVVGGGQCGQQHAANCGGGQQNSYKDLMALFGPADPDVEDPTVQITAPMDGEVFPVGADFVVTVMAQDDVEIADVELFVDGQSAGAKTAGPFEWPALGIPEGTHEFYAIARDSWGNEAMSAVVTVMATPDGTTGTSGGDGDGDGEAGDGDGGDGDGGNTTDEPYPGDAFPPGYGQERIEDTGCACAASPRSFPVALAFLLPGLLVLPRRRR